MRELQGFRRIRPTRVAFLVQGGENAQRTLDGIFADSYRRWGGRYSLIVPCNDGRISAAYWPWFEAYDPDIVYSYVSLADRDVIEIHERLSPSIYLEHQHGLEPRMDVHGFKPSFNFDILSSLSTIFKSARYRSPSNGIPASILDSLSTPSRFFSDNFGSYLTSFGTSVFPPDARAAASLLTVATPEQLADRRLVPAHLTTIPSEIEAMKAFAESRASSLSVASSLFAPKLELKMARQGQSFNLVVGSTFADRILFWNSRHFMPAWLDNDVCGFRVDEQQLEDETFVENLATLLNRRNFVNSGSGGQAQLTVRSTSISAEKLKAVSKKLKDEAKIWGVVRNEFISGLDVIVPNEVELSEASEAKLYGTTLFSQSAWKRFVWTDPVAKPPIVPPDHLSDAPIRQSFTTGHWSSDFIFEYGQPGPRFTNMNIWELPKTWRIAGAFAVAMSGGLSSRLGLQHRRSRDGRISVFESTEESVETITIPSAFDAIYHAIAIDGRSASERHIYGKAAPPNMVYFAAPSNESRYFEGVIGMAGSVRRAEQFLLHPFLQSMFSKFGGSPNVPTDKIPEALNRITKQVRGDKTFDLTDEDDKGALADMVIKASRNARAPQNHIKYTDVKSDWTDYCRRYRNSQQSDQESDAWTDYCTRYRSQNQPSPSETESDQANYQERSLNDCLVELRKREILFQGHRWTCRRCHHRNWVSLTEMKPEFICEVCRSAELAPIDINWQFRANEFLIESLRDHSVLSLLWLLSRLRFQARRSLIYLGPTWFWHDTDEGEPDSEADLLVLMDGKALVCEVKTSWRSVRRSDITKLVELAERLRVDCAILAVMDTGQKLKADIEAAKKRLGSSGIEFQLITDAQDRDETFINFDYLEES